MFAIDSPFETLARSAAATFVFGGGRCAFGNGVGWPDDYLQSEAFQSADEAILGAQWVQGVVVIAAQVAVYSGIAE